MGLRILLVIMLCFIFLGCVKVQEMPEELQTEKLVEKPAVQQAIPQSEESDVVSRSKTGLPLIQDVMCFPEGLLKFILANPYDKQFVLGKVSTAQSEILGLINTRITVNGREIAGLEAACGKALLDPGDILVCQKMFEPHSKQERLMIRLQEDSTLPLPMNSIRFVAPGYGYEIVFTCS